MEMSPPPTLCGAHGGRKPRVRPRTNRRGANRPLTAAQRSRRVYFAGAWPRSDLGPSTGVRGKTEPRKDAALAENTAREPIAEPEKLGR